MTQTFLQMIQTACDELGLNRPAVVINSTDLQIRQLQALMKRDLREVQQNYNFTRLQAEYDLHVSQPYVTTGSVSQDSYTVSNVSLAGEPTDFSSDFNSDFGKINALLANPSLFVINGQFIPVATRLTGASLVNDVLSLQMDQPATGNGDDVEIVLAQDTYPGPIDFDRFIPQTWWDRTNRWSLMGPDSPQIDQWHRSGVVTIGPRRHFRQIGYNGLSAADGPVNCYRLWPPPSTLDTPINIVFEYISKYCVLSAAGNPQATFLADTDIPILDENIFVLGAKWRLWQIKGFDYAALQQEYQDYVDRKFANDGSAKTLDMSGRRSNYLISSGNVQDGNYPSEPGGN